MFWYLFLIPMDKQNLSETYIEHESPLVNIFTYRVKAYVTNS